MNKITGFSVLTTGEGEPVAHLERQHWGRKIAAFLLRKMGIKNDRTAR